MEPFISGGSNEQGQEAAQGLFDYICEHGVTLLDNKKFGCGVYTTGGGAHSFVGYVYESKKWGALLMLSYSIIRFWRIYNGEYLRIDLNQ